MSLSVQPSPPGQLSSSEFEELVSQNIDSLYRAALRLTGKPADAEDLVQDTVLKALRSIHQFTPGTNFRAWVFRILRTTHISTVRHSSNRVAPTADGDITDHDLTRSLNTAGVAAPLGPEAQVLDSAADRRVIEAMQALSPQSRLTVYLADVEGFSYAEIADITDVKRGTVMSRLHRARGKVRSALEQAGHPRASTSTAHDRRDERGAKTTNDPQESA